MTKGETITCIGMTEPSGGSDLQAIKVRIELQGAPFYGTGCFYLL